jgi:hypothetical protein
MILDHVCNEKIIDVQVLLCGSLHHYPTNFHCKQHIGHHDSFSWNMSAFSKEFQDSTILWLKPSHLEAYLYT